MKVKDLMDLKISIDRLVSRIDELLIADVEEEEEKKISINRGDVLRDVRDNHLYVVRDIAYMSNGYRMLKVYGKDAWITERFFKRVGFVPRSDT